METATPSNNKIADFWSRPPTIEVNHFKYKALSNWSYNLAVGCNHACRFCYVPEVSTNRMASKLKPLGVDDPDEQWGQYVFVRPFDEKAFRASLRRAIAEDREGKLPADGNRAIMLCSTTDPYQMIYHPDEATRKKLNAGLEEAVRTALLIIRDESDLNVRILTRSPLAVRDFDIMATFGPRLMFGMSMPTLNDRLALIYEPKAPSPSKRRETLRKAKIAGIHVYVAVAPTYPECDRDDLQATFKALTEIEPMTIFHEPINIRAENVERIRAHAEAHGYTVNLDVFKSTFDWARYARGQLELVETIASELNLVSRLHLWPDKDLPGKLRDLKFTEWCMRWWARISEWPTIPKSTHQHRLYEKDQLPGFSDTGREREGKAH
jgi:DNA repair photolyase